MTNSKAKSGLGEEMSRDQVVMSDGQRVGN